MNAYAGSATDAKGRIRAISNDIKVTVQVLAIFKDNIQDEKHRHDAVQMCDDIFKEIDKLLQGSSKKPQSSAKTDSAINASKIDNQVSLLQKLKWPFMEPKLDILRGNLEKVKTTLQLLMSVVTFAAMSKMHASQAQIDDQIVEIERLRRQKAEADMQVTALLARHPDLEVDNINVDFALDLTDLQMPLETQSGSVSETEGTHSLSTDSETPQPFPSLNDLHVPDSTPVELPHLETLRADYVACIQQLSALQLTLEGALKKLFVSPGSNTRTDSDLNWSTRLDVHEAVRNSAQETEQYLRSRIMNSPVVIAMHKEAKRERSMSKSGRSIVNESTEESFRHAENGNVGRRIEEGTDQTGKTIDLQSYAGLDDDGHVGDLAIGSEEDEDDYGDSSDDDGGMQMVRRRSIPQHIKRSFNVTSYRPRRSTHGAKPDLLTVDDLLHRWTTLYVDTSTR